MPDYTITTTPAGENPGIRSITITGDMTIPHISGIRAELLPNLEGADQVSLELGAVSSIDTTGLQLLCATHRSFVRRGSQIAIPGMGSEAVRAAAEHAGLLRTVCCVADSKCACLWSGGEQL